MVCISDEVVKFLKMRELCGVLVVEVESMQIVKKAESDVGGSLNDGLHDLSDVFIFVGSQMIAKNGLLESNQRHRIGNKRLARIQIDVDAVNLEAW